MTAEELVKNLRERGVETRFRYKEPLYRQPLLKREEGQWMDPRLDFLFEESHLPFKDIQLSGVEKCAGKLIGLPNHPGLSPEEIEEVIQVVRTTKELA